MTQPTDHARWSTEEIDLLDNLIRDRLELEKDATNKVLAREETYQWLSGQFQSRGYNRSASAVGRRCVGRLQFRMEPKLNTLPSQTFNETGAAITPSSSRHQRTGSSSSDDIPLSQRRRKFYNFYSLANSAQTPQPTTSAPLKRKRESVESEIHNNIVVERRDQAHQDQSERTSVHPPAALVQRPQTLQPLHPSSLGSSQTVDVKDFDNQQGKDWLQKKTKYYQDRITKARSELLELLSTRAIQSDNQHRIRQAMQENDAESERLTKLLENLKMEKESLKHQQRLIEEAARPDEEHIRGLQAAIKEDERKIGILSAAAGF